MDHSLAVSYTHLDVYKRQILHSSIWNVLNENNSGVTKEYKPRQMNGVPSTFNERHFQYCLPYHV